MKKENTKFTAKEVAQQNSEYEKVLRDFANKKGITVVIHGEQGTGKSIMARKVADLLFENGYKVDLFDSGVFVDRIGRYSDRTKTALIDTTLTHYTPRKSK